MHCKKLVSMSLSSLAVVFLSFFLTMFTMGTTYALNHSSSITSDETWYAADNPHIVTTGIHVYSSATLTIEPGCLVKFDAYAALYIGYYSAATLNAAGTSGNPITFTSNVGTPAPADWQGIVFFNSTVDGSTIMDYCTVEYGGYDSYNSNIHCNNASPTIQNCTIQHSDEYGIYCDNYSAPTLTNNTISNNGSYPITEFCDMLDSNVTGNTGSANGTNAIEVRGGAILSSHTWVVQGFYFNVTAATHVYNGATLTIPPGCLVKFDSGTALYIGYYSAATLNEVGTSVNPITFTSNEATPAPGDWGGVLFYNSTDDAATIMDYCTVEYGGASSENSNIYCNSASPTIQNCTIRQSDGYGIYCDNYSAPTLTNNTISSNGSYPISEHCDRLDSNVTGNTGSANGTDAIEVRGGIIITVSSHTWIPQDFYFNVTSTIHVYNGATLTIPPGCLVKFDGGVALYIGYYSAATLIADGTSGSPITFTSNAGTPAPGDWGGILFYNSTDDAATIMDYCTVEYGGASSENSNINCNTASPTIQHCTIQHSDGYGIYCDNYSAPTLTNNTISNNGSFPISEHCDRLDSNVTGNTGSSNVPNAIEVRGGIIITVSSHTWIPQDFYFNVTSTIHVYNGATLTIPPGCLVKFDGGVALYIGYYSAATLIADGTSGSPITFTSNASTPAPGDWSGILFFNSTDDASTIMDYCTVEYGGGSGENSNIYCNTASPTIQNCTIQHSDGYGIYCDNYSAPTLTNNTISNNGSFPISEHCDRLDSNVTGNTGSSNVPNAIEVRGGIIITVSSHTWIPQDFYFNVTSTIHVYNGATLTIPPGCLVKFDGGVALYIGYYSAATLIADGTSGNPITFTSNAGTPAPGDWGGILFYNSTDDAATIMDYCTVEYGGASSENSNINCNTASPTIQHCIIRNSDGYGIYTLGSGAAPLISCSALMNNNYGVYATASSDPTVVDCRITGNTSYGVYSDISSITLDAENNWWGSSDGPSGVGSGSGDAVSNYVDFTPWRTAFDSCLETIVLSTASETNFIGSQHTVTATVENDSSEPVEGIVLFFYITSGPHAGLN